MTEVLDAYHHFFSTSLAEPDPATAAEREAAGAARALALFHEAAQRVPAYQDFLDRQGCDPAGIQAPADLAQVPVMDKRNYLTQYPLPDLCWDGNLSALHMI